MAFKCQFDEYLKKKHFKGEVLKSKAKLCICFQVSPTEEFASWKNFVNCFAICFDIGGLAKNKEGKGPWNYFDCLHCKNEEVRFTIKMRNYKYRKREHQDKERDPVLRERFS